MSIILKRPMFRKGGSVAEGTGITSGLTHRKRFADGSDNPMGDYVNTDDNDLYTNAQNADFSSSDIDREKAKEILKNIISKNIENEKPFTFNDSNISDNKEVANDWMDYLSSSGETPIVTTEPKTRSTIGTANVGDDYSQLGIGYETTPADVKKAIDQINKAKTIQGTQAQVSNKPVINTSKIEDEIKPEIKSSLDQFAENNPIYNAQGQNITPSLINVANVLKSQMTPSFSDNLNSYLRNFAGTAKSPLELQTWGSALGEASKEQAAQAAKNVQELNKYIGTVIGRTVGTLGKATSAGQGFGKLTGESQRALGITQAELGKFYANKTEAENDPQFMAKWKENTERLKPFSAQEKLELKDKATAVNKMKTDYRIISPQVANNLYDMLEDVNKGRGSVKAENVDQKLPHIKDLTSTMTDPRGIIRPVKNINSFNKYRENINYADPSTKKWYIFKRNPDGTDPRFEPVR